MAGKLPDYNDLESCMAAAGDSVRLTKFDLQIAVRRLAAEIAEEREAHAKTRCECQPVVAMLQEFTRRERAILNATGKGGMSVGERPTVTPSVLRELERMLEHAPDVQGSYDALQQRAERAEAVLRGLREWLADGAFIGVPEAVAVLQQLDELEAQR